jgi:hypothetical protein
LAKAWLCANLMHNTNCHQNVALGKFDSGPIGNSPESPEPNDAPTLELLSHKEEDGIRNPDGFYVYMGPVPRPNWDFIFMGTGCPRSSQSSPLRPLRARGTTEHGVCAGPQKMPDSIPVRRLIGPGPRLPLSTPQVRPQGSFLGLRTSMRLLIGMRLVNCPSDKPRRNRDDKPSQFDVPPRKRLIEPS